MAKVIRLLIFLMVATQAARAQTDSVFNQKGILITNDSLVKVYPNPAKDNVFVTVRDYDNRFRYNLLIKDNKGRPVKNIILLQPQQLIPLKASYGKGILWVEVWKEKELLGRQRLMVR
ncbi:MAG: hypothetical protein ACK4E8_03960 [Lacibacter sp.]|jgi:hypothetical protein